MKNDNILPTLCPHCKQFVSRPPCYLQMLMVLAPVMCKRYKVGVVGMRAGTLSQIARILSISRERVRQLSYNALLVKNAVIFAPYPGNAIYKLTPWGGTVLRHWLRAGWKLGSKKMPVQGKLREKLLEKRVG